ncbi:unnamed protein product [Parnassius mnemosyne]|uniref:Uncharacterized protein n=1 Tax=Parnassius mnemosyne TaxID=213953 RepID=A0AAV1LDK6_9NEOP
MLKKNCLIFLLFFSTVHSATLFESSYEYVLNLGKNVAPSVMSIFDCFSEDDAWNCAKEKAGKILDSWGEEVDKQRRKWQDAADAEVRSSGRTLNEMPSQLGKEVEQSLESLADLIQHGVARALERNHHESKVGIDMKTFSVSSNDKKRLKKKKQGTHEIHLHHPIMMPVHKQEEEGRGFPGKVQSWIIGARDLADDNASLNTASSDPVDSTSAVYGPKFEMEDTGSEDFENNTEDTETDNDAKNELSDSNTDVYNFRKSRGLISDMWGIGAKALDALAEHVIENENADNGIQDKSSLEEQRGKKKKKKKAILKLLILGAVLKAKIGTLLQILSFKLQVKFFIIALIGLAINLARFWVELKNKHHHQPQKVIYYEHAQHQHHYDEHEEEPGWGPWSRTIDPEEELDLELNNRPYRAQERISLSTNRPLLTLT